MCSAEFVFPAVKGIQAQREYYVSMVPLDAMAKLFQFSDENLPPEIRSQRVLNRARIPEIRDYILSNPESYVFSAMTVSVDGGIKFQSISEFAPQIGNISIPMTSRFLINDGQHRRAAILEAIKANADLREEHISVVFYHDEGLTRSQQIFSDLNRYAIKPTRSINILFNSREESSIIAKKISEESSAFRGLVEKERTKISSRSKAMFTLSAICTATDELLYNLDLSLKEKIDLAKCYWNAVSNHIPCWNKVKSGELKPFDIRNEYICSLSLTLVALGYAGNALMHVVPSLWEPYLENLDSVDWRKSNPVWDGLVFINGKVAANRSTQRAMSSHIKDILLGTVGNGNG